MTFYSTDRLVLLIDGVCAYKASQALGIDIDWRLFRNFFEKKGTLVRANYYSTTYMMENTKDKNDDEFTPLRPLLDWLDFNGYCVIEKPAIQFKTKEGAAAWRGTMVPEIVIDMCKLLPHVDHFVLFSGDPDLKEAVKFVQQNGKRVTLLSTLERDNFVSDQLRRASDEFMDLKNIVNSVKRNADGANVPVAHLGHK